uniref:Btz domain-containing protein n=1 Tax=Monopterus albus TaxID=43700 RepID=A0A3Q3JDE0_MONAL
MSRSTKSASRSRSRSKSRSRSRSTSHSRSHSRSRSRKHRYSSRSRSRSRSHSPSYNRDKKYFRGYQNDREFRGYHRGFRRPDRGRGWGYFPRGRYQRGGRGYNNNNFRPNWKNFKQYNQYNQKQYQQQYQQQQNNSQGQSHSLQRRSGSSPHGRSHQSDRSSSLLSRHSQRSSSSSHSSPKCRPDLLLSSQNCKDVKVEHSVSKEAQKEGGGDGESVELAGVLEGDVEEFTGSGKTGGNWQGPTECNSSPKKISPLANSAVTVGQNSQPTNQSSPAPVNTNDTSNGAPSWQILCNSPSTKKPSNEGLDPMLLSFDFSSEEFLNGDKTAISIAFRKFLEEQNKKAKSAWENAKNTEANGVDMEQRKANSQTSAVNSKRMSRKLKEDIDEVSLNSFLKKSPFLPADGEQEMEIIIKPHPKSLHKDWHNGDESCKPKSKVTHSAQELFGKWQNATYSQVATGSNSDLDAMAEEIYLSQKQDKAATFAVVLSKRELAGKFEELSPDMSCKAKKRANSPSTSSPTPPPKRSSDREKFMDRGEDSPLMSSRKQETKFNVRMDFLGDNILAEERQLSQDLVQSSKDQEFRAIFQHVQAAPVQRSPSELFAQHIVSIVHHIKAQHFASPGTTLNERFTMYQRRAAEKEMMKPRKICPRRCVLFCFAQDGGEKMKGDSTDLRLDIERRKKYSTHERGYNQDQERNMGVSPDPSRERSVERYAKSHKRSKKSKKKRSRSSSSSSSESESQKDLSHQLQIHGRGWNRGNCHGNSNPVSMAVIPKSDDWDPEYTPKSKKYYLHDDRDSEAECKWVDNRGWGRGSFLRGRARFITCKATGGSNTSSPKWAHDKFQLNGEQVGIQDENAEQDREEGEIDEVNS